MYSFISIHASGTHNTLYLPTLSPAMPPAFPGTGVRRRRNTVAAGASDRRRRDTTRVLGEIVFAPGAVSPGPWIQGPYATLRTRRGTRLRSIDRSRRSSDDTDRALQQTQICGKPRSKYGCTNFRSANSILKVQEQMI